MIAALLVLLATAPLRAETRPPCPEATTLKLNIGDSAHGAPLPSELKFVGSGDSAGKPFCRYRIARFWAVRDTDVKKRAPCDPTATLWLVEAKAQGWRLAGTDRLTARLARATAPRCDYDALSFTLTRAPR
ncbi:MAG: hypothetical protein HY075_02585 [Deltaproteobacteria bacterium]|nr:hypothetical protein [Deltaproteobacteria bacterium]